MDSWPLIHSSSDEDDGQDDWTEAIPYDHFEVRVKELREYWDKRRDLDFNPSDWEESILHRSLTEAEWLKSTYREQQKVWKYLAWHAHAPDLYSGTFPSVDLMRRALGLCALEKSWLHDRLHRMKQRLSENRSKNPKIRCPLLLELFLDVLQRLRDTCNENPYRSRLAKLTQCAEICYDSNPVPVVAALQACCWSVRKALTKSPSKQSVPEPLLCLYLPTPAEFCSMCDETLARVEAARPFHAESRQSAAHTPQIGQLIKTIVTRLQQATPRGWHAETKRRLELLKTSLDKNGSERDSAKAIWLLHHLLRKLRDRALVDPSKLPEDRDSLRDLYQRSQLGSTRGMIFDPHFA